MKGLRIALVVVVLAICGSLAAVASAGNGASAAPAQQATETGMVNVNFVINRFVRQGRRIVAQGAVVARYGSATTAPVIATKPFKAFVAKKRSAFASTARICDVLTLTLGPLHLELLGLIVDLSRVVLTIKADSNGGLLGSLFCGLAGGGVTASQAKLRRTAAQMTRAARANGLHRGVAGFQYQISPQQVPGEICNILDLTLGPLDLNLLGLMIHLDQLRLTITARRGGGILGDLLCGLAGGTPAPARQTS